MRLGNERIRQLNNVAIIIFGVLAFVCSFVLVLVSLNQSDEFERWQAAPLIQEAPEKGKGIDELQSAGDGSDVVVVGSIDPQAPASAEGFALYEYWERRSQGSGTNRRQWWEHVYAGDHKPVFQLLLDGDTPVTIQSARSVLYDAQDVLISGSAQRSGFAPGDRVTVFGTVLSSSTPFEVRASIICGGGGEECLEGFAKDVTMVFIIAAILILVGGGLVWLGIRRLCRS